jgi:hypothetical protein
MNFARRSTEDSGAGFLLPKPSSLKNLAVFIMSSALHKLLLFIGGVLLTGSLSPLCAQSGSVYIANGTYELVSENSGLALGATGTTDGSAAMQQTYASDATQQWTVTNLGNNVIELAVSGTNEALETPGGSLTAGRALDVSTYTGGTGQQWTLVMVSAGYYELVNVDSGYAVNVEGSSTEPNTVICQWTANAAMNERWSFTATGSSPPPPMLYSLTVNNGTGGGSYAAGTMVTIAANAPASGSEFAGWSGNTSALASASAATTTLTMPATPITVTATYATTPTNSLVADGTYEIVSDSSGLALAAGGTTDGSAAMQQIYTAAATQQWVVTNLGNNVVELAVSGTNEALQDPGSSTTVGTRLNVSTYTGSSNQQWIIQLASTGLFQMVNVSSGYAVNVAQASTASGALMCQWYPNDSTNALWSFTATAAGPPGGGASIYTLTVNNGTGSGSYATGATVTVVANAPASGSEFAGWTGNTGALASASSATTTLTMPAASTAITATYAPIPTNGNSLVSNGTYEIISDISGLALAATSATNGAAVVQQTYTAASTQQWTVTNLGNDVVELIVSGTNEALECPGSSDTVGTRLDVSTYTGTANQQWAMVDDGQGSIELINVNSGMAVNVAQNSTVSGGQICQWYANGSTNALWAFSAIQNGGSPPPPTTYALTVNSGTGSGSYAAGTVVSVAANAPPSGSQFAGWTGNTGALANAASATTTLTMPAAATAITATYAPIPTNGNPLIANGTYEIVSDSSGLALAAAGTTDGSAANQQTYTAAPTEQWLLTNLGNNAVELTLTGTNEALQDPGSSTTVGTRLNVSTYTGGANQQWTVELESGGLYQLVNVSSGDAVNVAQASSAPGALMCQWYPNGSTNALWSFTAVTPPTGSTPNPSLSPFGVACDSQNTPNGATWMPPMEQAGVPWARMSATWQQVEPTEGTFDYSLMDSILSTAAANNMQVSALLLYNTPWVNSNLSAFPLNNLPAWSTYVGNMVGRYAGKVTYWEIWNEPESFSSGDSPADYATTVVSAYNAAKAANPNAQIGLTFSDVDVNWMRETIAGGAADHFDYVAVHPYTVLSYMPQGWEGDFLGIVKTIRTMLAANDPARANVPIWFTEIGASIDGVNTTETIQAADLVKVYAMGIAEGVARMDWFEAQDGDSGPYGMLDSSGNERMAYHAMKSMIGNLSIQPAYQGWLLLNGQDYGFVFNNGTTSVMTAWAPPGVNDSVTFAGNVQVVNPLTEGVTSLAAGTALTLTNTPVIIAGVPTGLVATAQANKSLPFPWKGNYTGATSVNIQMGNPNVESGLHETDVSTFTPAMVGGSWVQDVSSEPGQNYMVDPNFMAYTPENIQVTVSVMAKDANAGFNFKYESVNGWEGIGWNFIPNDGQWHTFTFSPTDDEFVGMWGYCFQLNSDSTYHSNYYLQSVTIQLLPP